MWWYMVKSDCKIIKRIAVFTKICVYAKIHSVLDLKTSP